MFTPSSSRIWAALALFTLFSGPSLHALVIAGDSADQQFVGDGTGNFSLQGNSRVGKTSQADPAVPWDFIIPFALPTIPDGETINSATLTVNLEGWISFAAIGPVQLYGINRVNASPTVVFGSDFVDARTPGDNTNAVLLQGDFIPSSEITSTSASEVTSPQVSVDISSYMNNLYDSYDGEPGEFFFLTLAVDVSTVGSGSNNYYVISSANSTTETWRPFITYTTIPEPGVAALLLGAGALVLVRRRRR